MSIRRELFRRDDTSEGPLLTVLERNAHLVPGDLVVVRLTLRTDRNLDFVHVQDMRAAGLEPVTSLSGYRFKGRLGFYESIRDAATDFFIDRLPEGTHVFEYPLRVNLAGKYSAGVAYAESMYAPEFRTYSAGGRIEVGPSPARARQGD